MEAQMPERQPVFPNSHHPPRVETKCGGWSRIRPTSSPNGRTLIWFIGSRAFRTRPRCVCDFS